MSISSNGRTLISKSVLAALPAVAALFALSGSHASAAVLTYDADTTPPANDGTGVWNTTTANWFDGTNDVVWPNTTADTATFGVGGTIANAAAGTVTVGTVNVGTINFAPTVTTGYLLTGGTITLGTGITSTQTLGTTINSVITGTNGLAFTGTGTATVALGGNNTYTGVTTLGATGRLQLGNVNAFGSSASATATTLGTDYTQVTNGGAINNAVSGAISEAFLLNGNGGGSTTGALRIGSGNPIYNSLVRIGSSSQIFSNGGVDTFNGNVDVQNFALSINTFGGGPATTAGVIQAATNNFVFNGPVTGTTGSVAMQGSGGAYLFNGANTYTGATSISGTGILGGTGTIASGTTTIPSTSIITGANTNTVGTLTFTNALALSGTDVADLTAASGDTLAVGTTLTLGAASVLKLQGTTGLTSYTLATFTTLSGTFASVTYNGVAGVPSGYTLNYNANSITLTSAPEPASLAVLGMGGLVLLRRRSARRA